MIASAIVFALFVAFTEAEYDDLLNPVVNVDTMMWDGEVLTSIATAADCITQCRSRNCAAANFIESANLCLTSSNPRLIRRINTAPALLVKGGTCDAFTCSFRLNKFFLPGVVYEYAPGLNEVRSPQECFMLADLEGASAFVFHNDDDDSEGKGNACTFYETLGNATSAAIPGFFSAINDGLWAPAVV